MQNFEYNFNVNGNYSSANMSRATERQRLRGVVRRGFVAGRNEDEKSRWDFIARAFGFVRWAKKVFVKTIAEHKGHNYGRKCYNDAK